MDILFKTIHGSRLYGLSHESSDYDWYTVVSGHRKISQKIHGDQDNTIVDFGTFVKHANAGAPQALEAMFSQKAEIDKIADFRAAFVAGKNYNTFRGIMKRVSKTEKWDDFKHRRLVLRLGFEAWELARYGRFNPTLDIRDIIYINSIAESEDMSYVYDLALHLTSVVDS